MFFPCFHAVFGLSDIFHDARARGKTLRSGVVPELLMSVLIHCKVARESPDLGIHHLQRGLSSHYGE